MYGPAKRSGQRNHLHPVNAVVSWLALVGAAATVLGFRFRRSSKKKAEQVARRKAEMIRQRLQDEEKVSRRPVQIRANS